MSVGYDISGRYHFLLKHVSLDFLALRVWILLHHVRFHTYVHHDMSGLAIWTTISLGSKFGVVTVMHGDKKFDTQHSLYNSYMSKYQLRENGGEGSYGYSNCSDHFCIFGQTGDMM